MQFAERCRTGQFRCWLWLALGLLFGATLLCGRAIFSQSEGDRLAYQQLMESNQKKGDQTIAEQKRTGVAKEIFYMQGRNRLALQMRAAHSTLQLAQVDSETEIVEQLQELKALMQEELYYLLPDGREAFLQENGRLLLRHGNPLESQDYVEMPLASTKPMQTLRYFEAERATFYYKDNHLLADQVKLFRYTVPGHALQPIEGLKPMMTGMAKSAEISMKEGTPLFKASHLKAAFYSQEEQ